MLPSSLSNALSSIASIISAGMAERGGGRGDSGELMANMLQGVAGVQSGSSTCRKPVPRKPVPRAALARSSSNSSVFSSIVGEGQDSMRMGGGGGGRLGIKRR